ncbi:hypothetical protein ACP275_02G151400 [Erythranthe tilingii]
MANYATTTTQRPSSNPQSPLISDENEPKISPRRYHYTFSFNLSSPFNIPSTPESAAVRIIKNLEKFSLYYAVFVWTVLFIVLIPKRKVSIVYLVGTTDVAFLYSLLLRALPDSFVLNKIIVRRIVMFVLFVITAVEMILTKAAFHFFVVLASTVPIVAVHAVLSKWDDFVVVSEKEAAEIALLVQEKLGDDVSLSENLV